MKTILLAICLASTTTLFGQDLLTNEKIIEYIAEKKWSKELVIAKINKSDAKFDISDRAIDKLTKAKVPQEVIVAMVQKGESTSSPTASIGSAQSGKFNTVSQPFNTSVFKKGTGLYVKRSSGFEWIKPQEPQSKVGNQAVSEFFGGIVGDNLKLMLEGETAQTKISSQESKELYFHTADYTKEKRDIYQTMYVHPNPEDYAIVKMEVRDQKLGQGKLRVAIVARGGAFTKSGKVKGGIKKDIENDQIPFTLTEAGEGTFKLSIEKPMPEGEYALILKDGLKAVSTPVFSFTITN